MLLRTALRSLSRSPGYALASVALLALGIGAASGVFRAVDAVLFHPLVAPEPERLVRIHDLVAELKRAGMFRLPMPHECHHSHCLVHRAGQRAARA